MALSVASLTHGSDSSSALTVSTASITPGTGTVVLLLVISKYATAPSGHSPRNSNGCTWTKIISDLDEGGSYVLFNAWRGTASSPSTAPIVFDNPAQIYLGWDIVEVSGGPAPVQRQVAVSGLIAPPGDAGLGASLATSALIGILPNRDSSATNTVGSGYAKLNDVTVGTGDWILSTEWRTGLTTGACGWNWNTPPTVALAGIEIQVATGTATSLALAGGSVTATLATIGFVYTPFVPTTNTTLALAAGAVQVGVGRVTTVV